MPTSSRRILKWTVSVDDRDHPIGSGRVVLVACQFSSRSVQVWTDEPHDTEVEPRPARVYGTGQPLPADDEHIGSATTDNGLVWHVLARPVETEDVTR